MVFNWAATSGSCRPDEPDFAHLKICLLSFFWQSDVRRHIFHYYEWHHRDKLGKTSKE